MIKISAFTPTKAPWRNHFVNIKNIKEIKYAAIGKSGLPVEIPLNSGKDLKIAAMLQDSFSYDRAKDAIIIATNYSKK